MNILDQVRAELEQRGWKVKTITGCGAETIYAYPFSNWDFCITCSFDNPKKPTKAGLACLENLNSDQIKCTGRDIKGDFSSKEEILAGILKAAQEYYDNFEKNGEEYLREIRKMFPLDSPTTHQRIWSYSNLHLKWRKKRGEQQQ